MLIQYRRDGRLRLFRQHDHGLLAGALASRWRGLDREPSPLRFDLVLAIAMHDMAWCALDAEGPSAADAPIAFYDRPLDERIAVFGSGLDDLERIHPYAALMASLHYASFPDLSADPAFVDGEEERRSRLRRLLGLGSEHDPRIDSDLGYLQLFDSMSIFICLTPPSAALEPLPDWVESCRHLPTPNGDVVHLTWVDDDVLHADPFPFADALELAVPYVDSEPPGHTEPSPVDSQQGDDVQRSWWVSVRQAPRLA